MFENVSRILPIVYSKEKQNMKFLDELLADDIVPIGCIIKGVKSYYQEKEIFEDLLPCIVYKENYRA